MSKQSIKQTIDLNIYQNSQQRITGNVMNSVLNAMVDNEYTELDKKPDIDDNNHEVDLDLSDDEGNVLARFEGGEIRTKNFDSAFTPQLADSGNTDLDLTDENGNVLARFSNGHFKTKNFDSENINIDELEGNILYASFSMFRKVGVCGASWDSGYFYIDATHSYERNYDSWIANLARRNGISYGCYARRSANTRLFIDSSKSDFYPYCMGRLLGDSPCDLYIFTFGGNDSKLGMSYLGTIDDIKEDYTQNPDTFYGNYGRIISMVKEYAPNAKLLSIAYVTENNTEVKQAFFEAGTNIANHFGIPRLNWCNDAWFRKTLWDTGTKEKYIVGSHPAYPLYSGVAMAMERLFSRLIKEHPEFLYNPKFIL